MKKWITSTIIATSFIWPTFVSAETASTNSYPLQMVADETVTLRKGATTSYPIVASIPLGQQVTVIDEFTNSSGEKWYRVQFNHITGWALAGHLAVKKESNIGKQAVVIENHVAMRKGASSSYESIQTLRNGELVQIVDQYTNSLQETYYRIEIARKKGWVHAEQLYVADHLPTKLPAYFSAAQTAPVKRGASDAYKTVTSIRKGQTVTAIDLFVTKEKHIWYRIDIGKVKGWVPEEALKNAVAITAPSALAGKLQTTTYELSINVSVANVRQNPSTNAKVLTQLKKGTSLKGIAVSTDTKGAKWYKVVLANNQTGWVHETVVKTTASNGQATTISSPNSRTNQGQTATYQLLINVSVANVRQSPSTSSKVLTQLKKGTTLKGIAVSTDAKGAKWYKVVLANNQTGWVHETVVQVSTNTTAPSDNTTSSKKTVITSQAVLYTAPSLNATVVEKIQKNSQVTVMETANDSLFNWFKVTSPSGAIGWIPEFELNNTTTKYVYATTSSVALRRGASETYETLQTLSVNDRLLYLYSYNGWMYVETPSGIRGWVLEEETSPIAVNSLITPTIQNNGSDRYLEWEKTNNFKVSYIVLSDNRLKITGAFSYADIPTFTIDGIQSIEQANSSVIVTFSPGYTFTIRNYSDRVSIKIVETGLKGKKIIIDAGHGGHDTGAIGPTRLKEKDVNLGTALLLKDELEKAGAIVTLTRNTDVFLELSERTTIANNSDYDAFISIHADSYSRTSSGTTTYYNVSTNFNGPKSKILAQYVQKHLVAQLGIPNRGYKEQEFYVNRKNELPSILVELAFISNPKEEALLKTTAFRQKAAAGIRQGLEEYFKNF